MINITTLIPAIFLYVLPTLVGRAIIKDLYKRSLSYPFISYFATGISTLYIFTLLLNFILRFIFPDVSFSTFLPAIILSFTVVGIILNLIQNVNDIHLRNYILPFIFSIVLAFLIYNLWQFNSPYPFNWDIYEHQTLVNTILNDRFSFIASNVTDTFGFNGYPTILHTLIASSQIFFNTPIFDYWNSISYIHFTFIVLASYLFAKEITGNRTISIISGLLSALIFDSNNSFTTLFFIPQTFTAMIFMFLFIQLISEIKKNRLPSLNIIAIGTFSLLLNHYIIGTLASIFYIGTYLYYRYNALIISYININKRLALEIGLFVGLLTVIFSPSISLGFLNNGEAQTFTASLSDKAEAMKQIYGFLLVLFVPIGVSAVLRRKNEIEIFILILMSGFLTIILLQLPYMAKFYVLARIFVHFFAAIGIYTIFKFFKNSKLLYINSYIFLVLTLIGIFVTNASNWKGFLHYHDILTQVSPLEIEAADFLKEKYGNGNTLLVSDPATAHILEPFSSINTQGGAYMNTNTRGILDEISKTTNTKEVAQKLYSINDAVNPTNGKRLLALSGRYFVWQNSSKKNKYALSYDVWYPKDLTFEDEKIIQQFKEDETHFKLIYQNPAIAIFEVSK